MKQYIRKADIILLIALVIIGFASTAYIGMSKSAGDKVVIEARGEVFGTYSLNKDAEIEVPSMDSIHSDVHVSISSGLASVTESGCANQVCVRHSAISETGESIICLPNKVVVRIEGEGGGYDAITN